VVTWSLTLKEVDERAALLSLPYVAWTGYATALNGYIWWKNSGKSFFNQLRNKADKKTK
jgi:tryptophan-rich sensory protein